MPKISIIVPIYKAEKYLHRCVDSILNQTFTDFELILVDDGSPDKCGEICDEYAKRDKRIKVIHKENGGQAEARNMGIDIAKGEYLHFIDSDDWVHPQMLEILYAGIKKNDVLCSICSYELTKNNEVFLPIKQYKFSIIYGLDFYVQTKFNGVVPWAKLYHKSLFCDTRYPVGKIHEDEFVTYKVIYEAGNIAFCENKLYYYFINPNGVSNGVYTLGWLDQLEAWEEQHVFLKKHKLYKYYKWSIEKLCWGYRWHYYQLGKKPEYRKAQRAIKNKLKKILIFESKKCKVKINYNTGYYDVAFPCFMNAYHKLQIVKDKYTKYGIGFCIKKLVLYIFKKKKDN